MARSPRSIRGGNTAIRVLLALLIVAAAAGAGLWYWLRNPAPPVDPIVPATSAADLPQQVDAFCGACHAYPPANTFPRWAWKDEVERGYNFFRRSSLRLTPPRIDDVIRYYQERAPESLPPAVIERATTPLPVRFERCEYPPFAGGVPATISNVSLVHLSDKKRLEVLACDMGSGPPASRQGYILAMRPDEAKPAWRVLGRASNPAHAEVVDLDKDGIPDILVADLGSFPPGDHLRGGVLWLRGNKDGSYTPHTLLKGVGRVADVQAADFNGDGKLDLIVAVFGWQDTGEIILLENRTTDWDKPSFEPHLIDKRHGSIHVPVVDLNGDGKPDFVALLAQEHEEICAFINEGNFRFRTEKLYTAPHPAYGSSGIQLVDLDGDGYIDILYTNGDTLDSPHLLKPYHQVQWLRNRGNGKLDFEHRPIAAFYGVHRAVAADFNGDGKLDIVAVSYLPVEAFPQRDKLELDSIILLEQTTPGLFVRHTLEPKTCDHVTCVAGDVFGTGRPDVIIGNFTQNAATPALLVLKNLGKR
jgi:hypothetical protein